jgi:bacterioferritin-associated ferredoxin
VIVCSCRGVNDREIRKAIDAGAVTIEEVGDQCRAGTRCGGCWPVLADLIAGHTGEPVELSYRVRTSAA